MRSWKKLFQSRDDAGEEEEREARLEAVAVAEVEAWRHNEGVKKDEGVVEGLLLFDKVGRNGDSRRVLDDACRFAKEV